MELKNNNPRKSSIPPFIRSFDGQIVFINLISDENGIDVMLLPCGRKDKLVDSNLILITAKEY